MHQNINFQHNVSLVLPVHQVHPVHTMKVYSGVVVYLHSFQILALYLISHIMYPVHLPSCVLLLTHVVEEE